MITFSTNINLASEVTIQPVYFCLHDDKILKGLTTDYKLARF